MHISRRRFTGSTLGALAIAASPLGRPVIAETEVEDVRQLKPGQYVWYPERAPAGPMAIVVSLPDQLVYVYRDGIRIGVSTCATGRPGHETPTGVFTILQKDADHHSSLYNDAPMPFTERLTWSGVALHAGNLPGYPEFPRLRASAARVLEAAVSRDPVRHAGDHRGRCDRTRGGPAPGPVVERGDRAGHPERRGEQRDRRAGDDSDSSGGEFGRRWRRRRATRTAEHPDQRRQQRALRTRGRRRDRRRAGHDRRSRTSLWAPMSWCSPTRAAGRSDGMRLASARRPRTARPTMPRRAARDRVQIPTDVANRLQPLLRPGTTMMITDLPATADTRSGKDFVVLAQAATS